MSWRIERKSEHPKSERREGGLQGREFNSRASGLAGRQHGVVARVQLIELGLTAKRIEGWLRNGYLLPIHGGVYALGHRALRAEGYWMAAVLAGGSSAVLSHRSAAALWGFGKPFRPIEIVRSMGSCSRAGLLVHRTRFLPCDHMTIHRGIPVTTPVRTLVDLAAVSSPRSFEDFHSAARRLGLVAPDQMKRVLASSSGKKGTGSVRSAERRFGPLPIEIRSELETRFLTLCLESGIPRPLVNEPLGGRKIDFLWQREKLMVEVDSLAFHRDRFENDRARDLEHLTLGYETIRVTHRMIETRSEQLVSNIKSILLARNPDVLKNPNVAKAGRAVSKNR